MTAKPLSARSGSERPGIALLVAVVVLPLLMGLLLMWGLATPALHLDRVSAAIVNDDVPITINGTTSPLGRQFAAGLIAGTAPSTNTPTQPTRVGSNFDWVLTNDQDAADGLADGHYAAVLTIPSSFSRRSSKTSTSSPTSRLSMSSNSLIGITPSDL